MPGQKILLCIPHGGLNDTLCQIEKCRNYAQRFGRDLYIDTRWSGLMGVFGDFFEVRSSAGVGCVTRIDGPIVAQLNAMSVYPPEVAGHLGDYKKHYCAKTDRHTELVSGAVLSFDFDRDYTEQLIVHEQHGGGQLSNALLNHLTFTANLRESINAALATLPPRYEAIHVRHTDYKTNYVEFLMELREQLTEKHVLVCSDNPEVIASARNILRHSNVLTVTQLPDIDGKPLHVGRNYASEVERTQAAVRSLVDLVALANAESLFFTNIQRGFTSGFSRLALYLHKNKQIVKSLLGTPPDVKGETHVTSS